MTKLIGIVACDLDGGISYMGNLPWDIPSEKKYFLSTVGSCPMIMGRKTYQSMPLDSITKNSIILSTSLTSAPRPDIKIARDTKDLQYLYKEEVYYVIGGAEIVNSLIHVLDQFMLTIINHKYVCDTFLDTNRLFQEWDRKLYITSPDGYEVYILSRPL